MFFFCFFFPGSLFECFFLFNDTAGARKEPSSSEITNGNQTPPHKKKSYVRSPCVIESTISVYPPSKSLAIIIIFLSI